VIFRSACSLILLSRRSIQRCVVITQQFPYNRCNIIFLIFVIFYYMINLLFSHSEL